MVSSGVPQLTLNEPGAAETVGRLLRRAVLDVIH